MMRLVFETSELPHPNSEDGQTIYDVSLDLEKRYKILDHFFEYIKQDLTKRIEREISRNPKFRTEIIDEWVKNRWREWILDGNYGIITKASQIRGNQSFVDTGAYYMSMYPKLVIEDKYNERRTHIE